MTTNNHPITPPPELVQQWLKERSVRELAHSYLATQAARWGSDQELKACCDFLQELLAPSEWITGLRTARRPKPPSLKEQALELVRRIEGTGSPWELSELSVIRRALEALDDN